MRTHLDPPTGDGLDVYRRRGFNDGYLGRPAERRVPVRAVDVYAHAYERGANLAPRATRGTSRRTPCPVR